MMARTLGLALSALVLSTARGEGLTDEPLTAGAHQLLTGDATAWTAASAAAGTSVPATVPGDLITDLERAQKISDPLYERNFKSVLWDASNWTYATQFATAPDILGIAATSGTAYLVLDSVKMGAWVVFNGKLLGTVADQFLRYRFDVTVMLKTAEKNDLQLVFPPSNHSLNDEARWMACSGKDP